MRFVLPEKDVANISMGKEPRRWARNESIDWPVESSTSGPPELRLFIDFLRRLRLPGRLPSEPLLSVITPDYILQTKLIITIHYII